MAQKKFIKEHLKEILFVIVLSIFTMFAFKIALILDRGI